MKGLKNAAERHKRMFDEYVDHSQNTVTIRQPASKTSSASMTSKVFGEPTTAGATKTVSVIWNNDGIWPDESAANAVVAAAGLLSSNREVLDAVLRCKLTDVLIDPDNDQDETLFDTAMDVLYKGVAYKVVRTQRRGFSPIGPYVLVVGLQRMKRK